MPRYQWSFHTQEATIPFQLSPDTLSQNPYVDAHFGGNFLAVNDRLGEAGTFDEAAQVLGLSALRYPGGALTEQNLGILTPDIALPMLCPRGCSSARRRTQTATVSPTLSSRSCCYGDR